MENEQLKQKASEYAIEKSNRKVGGPTEWIQKDSALKMKLEAAFLAGASFVSQPPFPDKMTFKEMCDNLFNLDFMTNEEKQTIYDAGELYAQGCVRAVSQNRDEEIAIEFVEWIQTTPYIKLNVGGWKEMSFKQTETFSTKELFDLFIESKGVKK